MNHKRWMYNRVTKWHKDVTTVFVNHRVEEIHDEALRDCTELMYVRTFIDISETVKTIYSNLCTYVLLIWFQYIRCYFLVICYYGTVLNELNFLYRIYIEMYWYAQKQKGLLLQLYVPFQHCVV